MYLTSAHHQLRIPACNSTMSNRQQNRLGQGDVTDSFNRLSIENPPRSRTSQQNLSFYEDNSLELPIPARFPNYKSKQVRMQTFLRHGWCKNQPVESMAEAGFYFTNESDKVRCYHCGIGLSGWEPDDDPYVEHARWSPRCEYVISKKGQEFISLVLEAVEAESRPEEVVPLYTDVNPLDSDLEMDHGFVPSEAVPVTESTPAPISVSNPHRVCIGSTPSPVPNCQHAVVSSTPASVPCQPPREVYPESTLMKNPLLTDAAQSVLEMGYLPKMVKKAIDRALNYTDWRKLTGEVIMDEILNLEEMGETTQIRRRDHRTNFDHIETDSPQARGSLTETCRKLREENQACKDMTTCKLCVEEPVGIVFLPCGHLVSCPQCAPALRTCPMCRRQIKGTVKVSFN